MVLVIRESSSMRRLISSTLKFPPARVQDEADPDTNVPFIGHELWTLQEDGNIRSSPYISHYDVTGI